MARTVKINVPDYLEHKAETIMPSFKIVITNLMSKNNNHYRVEKYNKINGRFTTFPNDFDVFEFTGVDAMSQAQICAFKFTIEVI